MDFSETIMFTAYIYYWDSSESNCRSRSHEFEPGLVAYIRGDCIFLPSFSSFRCSLEWLVSVTHKSMCLPLCQACPGKCG